MNAKKILTVPGNFLRRVKERLRTYLESRTQSERLTILYIALALFALADICYIAGAFSGRAHVPQIRHIEQLKTPDDGK